MKILFSSMNWRQKDEIFRDLFSEIATETKKMYFERFAKKIICFYFNGTGIFIHRKYHKQTHYSDEKLKDDN